MKKINRKGFTIVELVIVIAVIAILSAVLIPTFSSLIRKANISSDKNLAKNLNTALAMGEVDGKLETFNDVIVTLKEAGFIVANLNPTTSDYYFVWEKESNQILLVDSANWSIVFQSKEIINAEHGTIAGGTWYFALSSQSEIDSIKALGGNTVYAPRNADELKNALQNVFGSTGIINESIHLGDLGEEKKVTLTDTTVYSLNNSQASILLDLSGNTIDTAQDITVRPFKVTNGNLTVSNGSVIAAGTKVSNPSNSTDGAGTGSYGTFIVQGENSSLNLNDVTLQNSRPWGLNIKAQEGATIYVNNAVISSSYGGGFESSGSSIIIENTTISQTGYHDHCSTCVSVSYDGSLTVKSGIFNAENRAIYVFNSGGTINIEGGTFNKTSSNSYKLIQLDEGEVDGVDFFESKIVVTGGQFTVNGVLKNFKDITENEWKLIVGSNKSLSIAGVQTDQVVIEAQ